MTRKIPDVRTTSFFYVALLVFIGFVAAPILPAQTQGRRTQREGPQAVSLIVSGGAESLSFEDSYPRARRSRDVEINFRVLRPGGVEAGDVLVVCPFDGEAFTVAIDRVQADINGILSIRGRTNDASDGYFLMSTDGACALGSLVVPSLSLEYYLIYSPERRTHVIQDADPAAKDVLDDAPVLIPSIPDVPAGDSRVPNPLSPDASPTNIDVMIVYTPRARDWASGQGGINLVISQAMEKGQIALDNSNSGIALRLVHSALVNYAESGSSQTDLTRLTVANDGFMDEIHQWRNTYGADLVDIFEDVEDTGGIGWLLNTTAGLPQYGFTLARIKQVGWTLTLVHELGHNMGCHHRKDQATQPGPGLFSYSAGWRWIGNDGKRYASVMSYTDSWDGYSVTQAPYFSSPLLAYQGAATGHPADGDNARTLKEIKGVISNYRSALVMLTIKATAGGTTTPSPGTYMYGYGNSVTVTATPDPHHEFLNWSGDASGTANPLTLTMTGDKTVTANFQRIIYPPLNAAGQKILNRSFSQAEHIHLLTWQAHPDNVNIAQYRIYQVDGVQKTLVATVKASDFSYLYRKVDKNRTYTYLILAVNNEPREGRSATLVVK